MGMKIQVPSSADLKAFCKYEVFYFNSALTMRLINLMAQENLVIICHGLASACNKKICSYSLTASPSPVGWEGESEAKGKTCGL